MDSDKKSRRHDEAEGGEVVDLGVAEHAGSSSWSIKMVELGFRDSGGARARAADVVAW